MHGHERGRGEHNEHLYYEVPTAGPEQLDEQQQHENQEEIHQQKVHNRRRQPARNHRRLGCGTH